MKIKQSFLLALAILLNLLPIQSQTLFIPGGNIGTSSNGNVGIGTSSPGYLLQLYTPNNSSYLSINKANDSYEGGVNFLKSGSPLFYIYNDNGNDDLKIQSSSETDEKPRIHLPISNLNLYLVESGGNVGIGTNSPQVKLQVGGTSDNSNDWFFVNSSANSIGGLYYGGNGNGLLIGKYSTSPWPGSNSLFVEGKSLLMNNVLIGKTTQTNTAYKLDVAGKIRADEIVVNTTGADFVFEPTYKLRSLKELETFIRANKRLPDIVPAKEMQEHGVSAGEMQAKLLQKVEELTLYVIEQSKQIETLKKENEQLKNENKSSIHFLTKEIESLKSNHPKH